jgi:ubiquinol-cytochrome c reductase iron-sulfur subunit
MSNELTPIDDSVVPQHAPRATDINPASEKRAEQQVAILFGLSGVGSVLLIYSYIFVADNVFIFIPIMGSLLALLQFTGPKL